MFIINEIWLYIKTFIFHNIKIHGKHLKDDFNIKNYNLAIKHIPNLLKVYEGPRIIYTSTKYNVRFVKFVYVLKHKNIRKLIITYLQIKNEFNNTITNEEIDWTGRLRDMIHTYFRNEYLSVLQN